MAKKNTDQLSSLSIFKDDKPAKNPVQDQQTKLVRIIFNIDPVAKRQLDMLAAEEGCSKTALLHEAVNDLFKKYDKEPIA